MAKGPHYYQRGSINVWDFIREQELNFHLGNAVKYICRAGYKDSKIQDLEKAIHYLEDELHHEADLLVQTSERVPYQVQNNKQRDKTIEDQAKEFDR